MTDQAGVGLASELRRTRLLVECVEDRAQVRVRGRHLKYVAAKAEADIDLIVEVDRRGVFRPDRRRCRLVLEKTSV